MKCFSKKLLTHEVRTYAVGGINDKNIEDVMIKYDAYGAGVGSGIFNSEAIFNGDFERVKSDVKKYVDVIARVSKLQDYKV